MQRDSARRLLPVGRPAWRPVLPHVVAMACLLGVLLALNGPVAPSDDEEAPVAASPSTPAGRWLGTIDVPGSPLEIEVTLVAPEADAGEAGGAWRGTISIPIQMLRDAPLIDIAVEGGAARFTIAGIPGVPTFDGRLDDAGDALAGAFTQGGARLTFALRRAYVAAREAAGMLDGLDEEIERAMARLGVPGLALGVVKNGEVVLARGYGWRDAERELPVTPRTLFAIGSSSKAFTTFVLATLADEGRFDFDEPLRAYLPGFRLADDMVTLHATTLDAVTHRTGLPRHDLVWYNAPDLTTATVLERLPHLEFNFGFRERYQYNNLMFLVAGRVAEEVGGASWEELVQARIFDPLGMTASLFSAAEAHEREDVALTYAPDDAERKAAKRAAAAAGDEDGTEGAGGAAGADGAFTYHRIPFRDIRNVGPAGGIMSNVEDMLRWVELHLGDGAFRGERLVSAATLAHLHSPVTVMGRAAGPHASLGAYAPGWMVDMYRGHNRVQHGGAIDGYICEVVLFPDDGLGIVAFANVSGTGLPSLVARHVADRLLGLEQRDWIGESAGRLEAMTEIAEKAAEEEKSARVEGTSPSHPLAAYAGEFAHPGYGTVSIAHDAEQGLVATYHGMRARLEHWHYDVFRGAALEGDDDEALDDVRVQFRLAMDGRVGALAVALEPMLPPIEFRRAADASLTDPAVLARLAGRFTIGPQLVVFTVRGGELVLDLPGQPRYVLEARQEWTFAIKGLDGFSVRFAVDAEGRATGATFLQPNGNFEATRIIDVE